MGKLGRPPLYLHNPDGSIVPNPAAKLGQTARFNRSLAAVARQNFPAEALMLFWEAIAEGHGDACMAKDARAACGWRVTWPEHGTASTAEQKQWAITQIRQAGFGMPVQSVQLDADLRAHMTVEAPADLHGLGPGQLLALGTALDAMRVAMLPAAARPAITSGRPALPVLDVASESAESASELQLAEPASTDDPGDPASE